MLVAVEPKTEANDAREPQVDAPTADDGALRVAEGPQKGLGAPGVPGAPEAKKNRDSPKAHPKPNIATVEELLRFSYESKSRLLDLAQDMLRKLPIAGDEAPAQNELITSLALTDPTLGVTYKLLQCVARQGVDIRPLEEVDKRESEVIYLARVLRRLVELSLISMSRHPVFSAWTDQLVNPSREPKLSCRLFRDEARKVDATRLGLADDQFKPADSERLVRNAVACFGLLRVIQHEWTIDEYIDQSYEFAWKPDTSGSAIRERIASTIAASRDLEVLGLVAGNYRARVSRLDERVAELERHVESAANREARRALQLQESIDQAQSADARAHAFSADIVRLQKELVAERDKRVVDKSHMADDYETLRTRIIRRLSGEVDLLTDALHAMQNGSPSVAEEFLDRSVMALNREVEQLRDAAGGLS
jgi:hypothetical protein